MGSRFIYRQASLDSSVGCRQKSYAECCVRLAVDACTVCNCVCDCVCDCVFEGGRMQLCGGDLPSVQEVKQRERDREHSTPTK